MRENKKNLIFSKKEYLNLSKVCDQILKLNLSNVAVIGLDFLHVKRFSSNFTYLYKDIYSGKIEEIFSNFILIAKYIFFAVLRIFSSFFISSYQPSSTKSHVDILIVSHYTANNGTEKFEDSYFAEIINQIDLNKFKVAVIYINHSNHTPLFKKTHKNIIVYALSPSIDFKSLIKIYLMSLKGLRKFKMLRINQLSKKISSKARIELFSPSTIRAQIIANHIKNHVRALSPKSLITTYEGHAWERLAFYYAREINTYIKCMSYQHAPIFRYQHAIKRGVGGKYDPDIIFASGVISEKQFLSYKNLKKSRIFLLGSGRRLPKSIIKTSNVSQMKTCLVIPEGTLCECLILFEFVLQCAHIVKDRYFLWRFPPQINIKEFIKQNLNFKNLPRNILVSSSSLEDDISKSEYVLYRGSSAVIHAVLNGLRPIYFMRDNELTMDPLFLCQPNDRVVRNADDFLIKIEEKIIKSSKLREHCNKLYSKLNIKILNENL
jgi:hypothetical protein